MPNGVKERVEFFGSKTECALLLMSHRLGFAYEDIRKSTTVVGLLPFSSDRKRMSALVKTSNGKCRLHTKGASEIVLGMCTNYMSADGSISTLTDSLREDLGLVINNLASDGLRTLCIAYKEVDEPFDTSDANEVTNAEKNSILIAIVGIKDPLRPEVPGAIEQCKRAGITVRMVTGDSKPIFL